MAGNGISTIESRSHLRQNHDFVPQADTISLETVVNMLVQKGVCTVDELFMLEGRVRDKREDEDDMEYLRTKIKVETSKHSSNHNWLKRKFSKYRWSRRLGSKLFGWKWKKVKRASRSDSKSRID
jgi:hypothetical protein